MNLRQQYYMDGYHLGTFPDTESIATARALLEQLHAGAPTDDLPAGFSWEEKYRNTRDLRPSVYRLDSVFLDILFDADIPRTLKELTGEDLSLVHVQIRVAGPGPSYMDWHRDTHFYGGNLVGNAPPVHKLIYYPLLGREPEEKLQLQAGSHTCIMRDVQNDQSLRGYQPLKHVRYSSSQSEYIVFDTSCMHGVIPDKHPDGSIRILYSFMRDWQYRAKYAVKDIHSELYEAYERTLNGN